MQQVAHYNCKYGRKTDIGLYYNFPILSNFIEQILGINNLNLIVFIEIRLAASDLLLPLVSEREVQVD